MLAIELSGEHPRWGRAEAREVLVANGARNVSEAAPRLVTYDGAVDPQMLAGRLALARRIVHVHAVSAPDPADVVACADMVPLDGGTFAVRVARLDGAVPRTLAPRMERALGEALASRAVVDLEAPGTEIAVLIGERAWIGTTLAWVDRGAFEARHVEERPYFSPISLHPRMARALCDLGAPGTSLRVWDPFAGTGGIALEAAVCEHEVIATDIDQAMVDGTRSTLAAFERTARVLRGDVLKVAAEVGEVDAIVTDPPYGRASSTHGKPRTEVYARLFAAATTNLAPGGRLATILPALEEVAPALSDLRLVFHHPWFVHGSLTRHVLLLERR